MERQASSLEFYVCVLVAALILMGLFMAFPGKSHGFSDSAFKLEQNCKECAYSQAKYEPKYDGTDNSRVLVSGPRVGVKTAQIVPAKPEPVDPPVKITYSIDTTTQKAPTRTDYCIDGVCNWGNAHEVKVKEEQNGH